MSEPSNITNEDLQTLARADQTPRGRKYFVNIEGTEFPWHKNTITREEIAELGGWNVSLGVIEVDENNVERTLEPGEVVELKPG